MIRRLLRMHRSDRRVLLAALTVGLLALLGVFFAGQEPPVDDTVSAADTLKAVGKPRHNRPTTYYATEQRRQELFPFDPNTADSTQLLRLGLQPWQVRNIYRYRARGGIYRKPTDFARLYGLTVKDYRRLEPYIRISADYQPAATLVEEERRERDTVRFPVKIQEDEHVVLNQADTSTLKKVPGIGSYYARQIARYGQRLGGYVSVDQLDEIEGFPQEAKKYFVIVQPQPQKLNVNRLTLAQLRSHPYINFYQAKAIVDYRRLRGNIKSLADLRLSKEFTDDDLRRLEPYVAY